METDITNHRLYSPRPDTSFALGDNRRIIWRAAEYSILDVGRNGDLAYARTDPHNPELEFELARIIADNPNGQFDLADFRLE